MDSLVASRMCIHYVTRIFFFCFCPERAQLLLLTWTKIIIGCWDRGSVSYSSHFLTTIVHFRENGAIPQSSHSASSASSQWSVPVQHQCHLQVSVLLSALCDFTCIAFLINIIVSQSAFLRATFLFPTDTFMMSVEMSQTVSSTSGWNGKLQNFRYRFEVCLLQSIGIHITRHT